MLPYQEEKIYTTKILIIKLKIYSEKGKKNFVLLQKFFTELLLRVSSERLRDVRLNFCGSYTG